MIDLIMQQFKSSMSDEEKLNRVREFLQIVTLKIIYDKGFFKNIVFVGGTALRIIYDLRRFSEDLDFSLVNDKGYAFSAVNSEIERGLKLYGLDVEAKAKEERTVHSSLLKFSSLLKKIGLSQLESQKLSIKIEVDSRPPNGGNLETTLVNKVYLINIAHLDISSMYATKLHACLFRKYAKGRDFYDLVWYLTKKITPNFILLNNAIEQTQGENLGLSNKNLKDFLSDRIGKVDFKAVRSDADRFLEDKNELKLLDAEVIKSLIVKL
ncbi:MAG: nucleotidyl transferase AbiEii/AbiGii toxin family protein [Candidatus Omnitrophota bacterium]|nr:nucleotidyl transferase AbiEii/AbiGii toxin family protein [Candidatus Omnitrophota bacterium]